MELKKSDDLLRVLLLRIEEHLPKDTGGPLSAKELMYPNDETVSVISEEFLVANEHLRLLMEKGFLDAIETGVSSNPFNQIIRVWRLTWLGHEFLDSIRDPEIWSKTKEGAVASGGFSLEIIGALAKGLVKQKVQKHTGIEIEF